MRRRDFISLIGGAATWPLAARGQQSAMPVVGFLGAASPGTYRSYVAGFLRGLNEVGYVEGRNVAIEYRWADGAYDRLPSLAADLVHRQVNVIFTGGSTPATLAARAVTTTIPIVFYVGSDPVALELVASLARPGGNLTGLTSLNLEVGPKRLELLRELLPGATSIALLINPTQPDLSDPFSRELQAAARKLGVQLHVLRASTEAEIDTAFSVLAQLRAGGLVIGSDVFFNTRSEQLAALSLRHAVPTIYQYREFSAAGGLMSYGTNIGDGFRLCGVYAGRILKGERPDDLPVMQATKVELIINMKAAKALGLTVPLTLLGRADEVIE
jgi:putative ABC transport system substrate-binding protein